MLKGAFGVLCVGSALVYVQGIGWCLETSRLEHWRRTSAHLEVVSADLSWLSTFVHF